MPQDHERDFRSGQPNPSSPNFAEPDQNQMREAAHGYADFGYRILPAIPGTKMSFMSADRSAALGEEGASWGATKDKAIIDRYFDEWSNANIGLPAGKDNGFFVVDLDTMEGHGKDGIGNLKKLIATNGGEWPETLTSRTPTDGKHYLFKYPDDVTIINKPDIVKGVDIIGEGGMILAPPSIKPGVGIYRWGNAPHEIVDAPRWLIDLVKADERECKTITDDDEIDVDKVIAALDAATNDDLDEDCWYRIVGSACNGSGGHPDAKAAVHRWSKKSKKYKAKRTTARWNAFVKRPPHSIRVGTLYRHADETNPGWRDEYIRKSLVALGHQDGSRPRRDGVQ